MTSSLQGVVDGNWNGTAWIRIPDPGAQGVQGATGAQVPAGAQDLLEHKVQVHKVLTAAQGAQGAAGSNGSTGAQGAQGNNGSFGGVSYEYSFSTNTTDSDPGAGT